jgi:hypothetical protein
VMRDRRGGRHNARSEGPAREVVAGHRRIGVPQIHLQAVGTGVVIMLARTRVSGNVTVLYSARGLPVSCTSSLPSPKASHPIWMGRRLWEIFEAGVPRYNLEKLKGVSNGQWVMSDVCTHCTAREVAASHHCAIIFADPPASSGR